MNKMIQNRMKNVWRRRSFDVHLDGWLKLWSAEGIRKLYNATFLYADEIRKVVLAVKSTTND